MTQEALAKVPLPDRFEQCAVYVAKYNGPDKLQPDNDMKLKFYAMYKQGKKGDNNTSKPGMFDMVGKAKWSAWAKLRGTTKPDAMRQYIACVENVQPKWYEWSGLEDKFGAKAVSRQLAALAAEEAKAAAEAAQAAEKEDGGEVEGKEDGDAKEEQESEEPAKGESAAADSAGEHESGAGASEEVKPGSPAAGAGAGSGAGSGEEAPSHDDAKPADEPSSATPATPAATAPASQRPPLPVFETPASTRRQYTSTPSSATSAADVHRLRKRVKALHDIAAEDASRVATLERHLVSFLQNQRSAQSGMPASVAEQVQADSSRLCEAVEEMKASLDTRHAEWQAEQRETQQRLARLEQRRNQALQASFLPDWLMEYVRPWLTFPKASLPIAILLIVLMLLRRRR